MHTQAHTTSDPSNGAPYRRALVVANPIAGRGQGSKVADELSQGLRAAGISTETYFTRGSGDAFTHLRGHQAELDLVVAVGGDGTVREVLDGLVDPSTPVGVLPLGTANVLAKELGLPRDVHHSLDILLRKHVISIDVAQVNGRLSALMTGIGMDAYVVREVEQRRRGPITKWNYVTGAMRALWHYRAPRLHVTLDGKALPESAGFVLVSNTVNYGGVLKLAPDSRMDDGLLEVYVFPSGGVFELAIAFLRGFVRNLPGGKIQTRRAKTIEVRLMDAAGGAQAVPFQVDGDLGGETPVEIRLAPNQYRLVVP